MSGTIAIRFCVVAALLVLCSPLARTAEISVGRLNKEEAQTRYGITMHARPNGDAGVMVWLEFEKKGWLEAFTYAELQIVDSEGKHRVSARLQPHPVRLDQEKTSVSFSAEASELERCSFLVVCYGSNEGDVGYELSVKDFIDLSGFPSR